LQRPPHGKHIALTDQAKPHKYPGYEFGGNGPLMHLAIANGFPPPTYILMVEGLLDQYHVFTLPPRALWTPTPPYQEFKSWREMAADLLAGLREREAQDVIAVGHSYGGVASALAVLAEPQRFRALILLDPTFLPPRTLRRFAILRLLGYEQRHPLSVATKRRRDRFESVEVAYQYWRGKRLFEDWPDATLRLYAGSMTKPAPDGDGVVLAWSREWEARYYEKLMTDIWKDVRKLRGLLPILAIRGTESDTFTEDSCRTFRRYVPEAAVVEIEGRGHLFPQSAPDHTRHIIVDWLNHLPVH